MSLRQRIWANKAKARLVQEMGAICWCCGSGEPLEIDHIDGRKWSIRKTEFSHRICRYRREWKEGKVQLLCPACNKAKIHGTRYEAPEGVEPTMVARSEHGEEMVPF